MAARWSAWLLLALGLLGGDRGARPVGLGHPAAALQVLVHAARQHPQGAVAEEGEDPVGGALDEEAVVGDDDHRAGPAVEEVLQLGQGLDVQVVGGLVEEEDVGLVHEEPQDLGKRRSPPEVADRRPLLLLGEAELLAELPGRHLPALAEVDPVPDLLDGLQDPGGRVEFGDLLGEVGELDGLADDHLARDRLGLAAGAGRLGQGAQQGGLAGCR